ncbi:uncharacterized protein PV07_05985 [Cladophialophora immunda]|uniref:Mitochondrial thiamine pyrophosphate carrier 1 n=1 Tax=Cladophialophora immunda TaxID=569365 RepID=A0A0D1ZQC8_9EURO|nr:uncharacterized protein PV07_05985 [Cladophialophora immunda]KIW30226.1 hypothetical protein PV07_05985 [Cladophialophora immunda]
MEVIKTRIAANRGDSFPATLRAIWARGGVLGFYQGLIPWAWAEASSKGAVLFFVSSDIEHRARSLGLSDFASGLIAGMAGGAAQAYMVMGVCTRMKTVEITKRRDTPGHPRTSTWTELREIWNRDGIRGVNRGANAVALRQMSNWGSRLAFARLSEDVVRRLTDKRSEQRPGPTEKVLCAAIGGGLACWNQPIEVVRVEMQRSVVDDPNRPKRLTTWSALAYVYRSSGVRGLYRGVLPRMCLGIWQTICMVALGDMYVISQGLPS